LNESELGKIEAVADSLESTLSNRSFSQSETSMSSKSVHKDQKINITRPSGSLVIDGIPAKQKKENYNITREETFLAPAKVKSFRRQSFLNATKSK
jgi:hypothetical protein